MILSLDYGRIPFMLEDGNVPDYSLISTGQLRVAQSRMLSEVRGINFELSKREDELASRTDRELRPLVMCQLDQLRPWQLAKAAVIRALVDLINQQKTGPFKGQFWKFNPQGTDYVCGIGTSFMELTETVLMQASARETVVEDVKNQSSDEQVNILSTRSFVGKVHMDWENGAWIDCRVKYGTEGPLSLPARLKEVQLHTISPHGRTLKEDPIDFILNARSWLLEWGRPVVNQKGWSQVSYDEAGQRLLDLRRFANKM